MANKELAAKVLILNKDQIAQKINRIAYQILEDNLDEKEVVIAGMGERGFILAKRIEFVLRKIASFSIQSVQLNVETKKNSVQVNLNAEGEKFKNSIIILVDDVLNSGRTLAYGFSAFLNEPHKKIRTVVLVDRSHKVFPIATDFVGLNLATVLKEHVEVVLDIEGEDDGVYLS